MKAEWEGKEKEVRKAEEEEKGLDLSKSDQQSKKKLAVTGFLPAAKADLIFPPDGWRPLDCGHRVT